LYVRDRAKSIGTSGKHIFPDAGVGSPYHQEVDQYNKPVAPILRICQNRTR